MKITERYKGYDVKEFAIQTAYYIGDFAIRINFDDGHQKLVDFKPFLEQAQHPSIRKYLNESLFKQFQIRNGNLDWNDFDLCFPISDLYHNIILKEKKITHSI